MSIYRMKEGKSLFNASFNSQLIVRIGWWLLGAALRADERYEATFSKRSLVKSE